MSSTLTKLRKSLLHVSAAAIVGAIDQSFAAIAIAIHATMASARFVCGITDGVCSEPHGFDLNPCGHMICARHLIYDALGVHVCPACGTPVVKMTEHAPISITPPSFASFFGRAAWADPPAALMGHLLDETPPELHRGLFIGFISVIQARVRCPIEGFAAETLSALEYQSSRECDLSPLAGLAVFFVVWRHQLREAASLNRMAEDIARIACGYGLFATWTRDEPHPSIVDVADFLAELPDTDLSVEAVTDIYRCTIAMTIK